MGIYLNYIPQGTAFMEMEAGPTTEPTPALVMLQPFSKVPVRKLFMPKRYEEVVIEALKQCGIERECVEKAGMDRMPGTSSIRMVLKKRQKVCYLWIDEIGEDLVERVEQQVRNLNDVELNVIYLQIPMNRGPIDGTIDALRQQDFFYAGTLPEYGYRDWLTLQKVDKHIINLPNVKLANQHCYGLLDYILQDQG